MKSALSADLYPEILQSVPVQWALLLREVQPRGGPPMTLLKYLDEHKPFDLWESGGDAVATVANSLLGAEQSTTITTLDSTVVRLSQKDARILDELRERVDAFFNLRTGILDISVDMPDPEVAAQVAGAAVEELTRYMKEYRRSKLEKDLEFIEIRHAEARARFNASLDDLARFRDRNQHLARDLARTEDQRLQAEYDLAFNVYNSLSTRLEESRIAVEEETPVFQVLEPVSVPLKKSYPARGLTLMLCGILGLVTGAGISIFREDLQSLARSSKTIWKREEEPAP
jgi:uncharacterized protein involved in exopolysaccharide biosynthesis